MLVHLTLSAILTVAGLWPGDCRAQVPPEEREALAYAQRLYADGLFDSAADEFRQFILNHPTSDRIGQARQQLADAYFHGGKLDAAVEAYQNFVDRHPESLEVAGATRNQARALERLGQTLRAAEVFRDLHDRYPGSEHAPRDLLSAGANHEAGNDLAAAEADYRDLLALHGGSALGPEALFSLGRVLLALGRDEEALRQLRAIRGGDREPDALLEMGRVALGSQELDRATAAFEDLRARFPKSPSAEASYLVLAEWHAGRGEWEKAAGIYEQARISMPPGERRQKAVLGLAGAFRRLDRDALPLYGEFIRAYGESPHLPEARLGLARAYADRKDWVSALEAFKRLQEQHPDHPLAVTALRDEGDLWRNLGDPQKALSAYTRHAERVTDPTEKARADIRIAQIYEADLAWFDLAEVVFRRLAAEGPHDVAAEAQFGLARCFERSGRPVYAGREYRAYIKRFPAEPRAADAERRMRLAEEFTPENSGTPPALLAALADGPSERLALGVHLYNDRRFDEAARILGAAAADTAAPTFEEALYRLGLAGDRLAARAAIEGNEADRKAHRDSSLSAFSRLCRERPESPFADDAAIGLIEGSLDPASPDTARHRALLGAYAAFQKDFPGSDRLEEAALRIADAHLLSARGDSAALGRALAGYRAIRSEALAERAAYGVAVCLARKGDYAAAEEALRAFQIRFPASHLGPQAQFHLGWTLVQRGFLRSAAEELALLRQAPSSLDLDRAARALLAECYFRLEDYPRAIEIDKSLSRDGDPSVLSRLALSYRHARDYRQALSTYAEFAQRFPTSPAADSVAFSRGELLSELGRAEDAAEAFQAFGKAYPNSALRDAARRALVGILFRSKRYDGAVAAFAGLPEAARDRSVCAFDVVSLYRLDRVDEARNAAGRFRKAFPAAREDHARLLVEEGSALLRAGRPKDARGRFENVAKDFAASEAAGDAKYHIVAALEAEGKAEEHFAALLAFVKDENKNPNWWAANLALAGLYEKSSDFAGATRAYQNALSGGLPQDRRPEILHKTSNAYASLRLYDSAIAYARALAEDYPRLPAARHARLRIGELLHEKGDHAGAIRELSPQVKDLRGDEWSSALFTIAESYKDAGDYDAARREYLKIIYNPQGSPFWIASALMGRAVAYQAQGRGAEAIEELQKIVTRFGAGSEHGIHATGKINEIKAGLNGKE